MFWLEIGPLGESEYTGIPNVVCNLARQMLADRDIEARFFFERREVPCDAVAELIEFRSGTVFKWIVRNTNLPPVSALSDDRSVGIFGSVKTAHFLFDYEAQIVHDFSSVVTPQYHHAHTIRYHSEALLRDLATNDLNICVSSNTKSDLETYFPEVAPGKTMVAHLGYHWPDRFAELYQNQVSRADTAPYVLVLGTIEPRKNIDVVLAHLARNRGLLERFVFVFCGRHGWGPEVREKLTEFGLLRETERGRLVFTGFVGEFAKYCLLSNSTLVVYPSLFEGFGLPVLEAISLGKAVVTTASSSIPEVGGDAVSYFNPFEPDSFGNALASTFEALAADPEAVARRARARSQLFSWQKFYGAIKTRILDDLARRAGNANQCHSRR